MKKFGVALVALAFALPAVSHAQTGEFWFSAGQSILSNRGIGSLDQGGPSDDFTLTNGFRFSLGMTINTGDHLGYEFGYAYNRTHLDEYGQDDGGMAIHQGFGDVLLYATKGGSRIRPFVAGGVQFSNFVPPGTSATEGGGSTKFGFNAGFGVKVKLTSMFAARVDYRLYTNPKPDFGLFSRSGWFEQSTITAGFGVYF
jgi:opacity protein-like surface antigen